MSTMPHVFPQVNEHHGCGQQVRGGIQYAASTSFVWEILIQLPLTFNVFCMHEHCLKLNSCPYAIAVVIGQLIGSTSTKPDRQHELGIRVAPDFPVIRLPAIHPTSIPTHLSTEFVT